MWLSLKMNFFKIIFEIVQGWPYEGLCKIFHIIVFRNFSSLEYGVMWLGAHESIFANYPDPTIQSFCFVI